MRLLTSLLVVACCGWAQTYSIAASQPGWDAVFRSLGLVPAKPGLAQIEMSSQADLRRVEAGGIAVIEGFPEVAGRLGVTASEMSIEFRQIRDVASAELPIVWKDAVTMPVASLSDGWQVRARERWHQAPVLAYRKVGKGAVVWVATPIGESGYERYPYLPQALLAAGVKARVRSEGLWAFFDAGFRQRADLGYLVSQWKAAGIGGIHVTSWQFDAASEDRAEWLRKLITLCHDNLIHVYAWVELPHVSEGFWQEHPECREKTATGMDASLDWRRLTNLIDPRCSRLVEERLVALLRAYDWDGVNLGELYFESLEGSENPARFTPFHPAVREDYKAQFGRDPLEDLNSPRLLEYRANLAARLQADWLSKLETLRKDKPGLDIVLTHIDDRFDTRMRDALGADAARVLRGTEGMGTGFLIEDPATVWHLGPSRYREIRKRYEGLTKEPRRLAIDLNIVERYQDVYPTRRQTGAELAQLVHEASASFDQVALYFEYSLRPVDLPLLGLASARVEKWDEQAGKIEITLGAPARVAWKGAARVNGIAWPLTNGESILLPAGAWTVESSEEQPWVRVVDWNVRVESVERSEAGLAVRYSSRTAGVAVLETDGVKTRVLLERGNGVLQLSATRPAASTAENSSARLLLPH